MPGVPETIEFCISPGVRDVRRATVLYLANPFLLTLVAVIACAEILNAALNDQPTQLYIFTLVCLFLFLILPWIQAVVSMRNPVMKSPFCHTLSPPGISTKFRGGSLSLEWSNIKKAVETKEYVAVYGKRGAPLLIPKRQLREGNLGSLRTILKLQLQEKAKVTIPH